MKIPFSISRLLLFTAMGGLILLSFLAIRVLERDVQAYRQSNQEAIHWSAAQVEVELSRFLLAVNRFSEGDPGVDNAEVNRRFDLLWSRSGLFRSGSIGERLRRSDEGLGAIPLTIATLQQNEGAVLNLKRSDVETARTLIAEFGALEDPLRKLSVKVLDSEQDRYAQVRQTLLASSELTFWVWASTLLIAALLVGVMFLEARRYQRTIRETATLAEQAQAANRAKSRFLTMMSHELRTPMNGVMGLMALAKQTGLTTKQLRLVEQAERSGAQMVGLLGDILDFSDLETERLAAERNPFQPKALGSAVCKAMEALTIRNALTLEVECPPTVPEWVEGDLGRLRQSLVHFSTYFVETVGTRDLRLVFGHDETHLIIEIDIATKEVGEPGWQPEAIFGSTASNYGEFASDAVGPTIARSFIEAMSGTLRIRRDVPGRARLNIKVPARPVVPTRDLVRVETHSDTTALLLHTAIDESGWQVWSPSMQKSRVGIILMEVGGNHETEIVARLREEHSGASVVAIGHPEAAEMFDAVETVPVDFKALAERLHMRTDGGHAAAS